MSLNHITENKIPKPYFNPYFNSVKISGGADFLNSGITDLSSINGLPIPPLGLDPNPVNVIYKPGTVTVPGSNIVGTWAEVVSKAGRINVSQTLNIYFDDFVTSPCPITQSIDFHGRTYFYSASERLVNVNIIAGVTITNLRGIRGPYLYVTCSAETPVPSLAFTSVGTLVNTFEVSNNSQLDTTNLTTGPVILLNDATLTIYLQNNGSLNNSGNTLQPTIQLTAVSTLYINNQYNSTFANNLVSDDGTCAYVLNSDASLLAFPTNSGFTGTYTKNVIDNSSLVEYKDNLTPTFGSSVVQGALDYIKQNYQKSNSTSPMTSGAISCASLLSSGTMSCGTNSMTCGALSSGSITSSGNFTNGTNPSTTGSLSCGAITSSGIISNGTNSSTTGALSCGAITSSGIFSNGTNSLTCGAITSSGTISNGTNSLTCGAITSSGTISNGTNAMTCGSLSCTSINSTGNIVFPYYSLSADLNTTQSIPNSANTLISFNQVQLNNNWGTVTPPVSSFTIPVAGWYKCTFSCVWDSNAIGERQLTCFLNGGTRFFGSSTITACQTDKTRQTGSFQWQFAGGESLTIVVFQSSGGAINIGSEACYFAIDRSHT